MRKGLIVLVTLVVGTAFVDTAFAQDITILPIDRAKMLVGSRFDFRVELAPEDADLAAIEAADTPGAGVPGAETGAASTETGAAASPETGGAAGLPDEDQVEILINGEDASAFFEAEFETDSEAEGTLNFMIREVMFMEPGEYTVEVNAGDLGSASVTYEIVETAREGESARNVILFVADGLTQNQVAAARLIAKGQQQGKYNELLSWEEGMDGYAMLTTSGMDSIITDSANSASAYATGHKSAVNAMGVYPANLPDPNTHPRQELITEMLRRTTGKSIGVITDTYGTDATPAAFYAHTRRRAEGNYIAAELFDGEAQPDVIMMGGSRFFIPGSTPGSVREDERDLIAEAEEMGYEFVSTASELGAATAPENRLFGLFHDFNMNNYLDKAYFRNPEMLGDYTDQPLMWDVVMTGIEVLNRNDEGFFLIVEFGNVDKLLHPLDWHRATWDMLEMERAVEMVKAWIADNGDDTLLLVTADHGHSLSTYGTYDASNGMGDRNAVGLYADAGFPSYGDELDENGIPVPDTDRILAVAIGNHPDYCELYGVTNVFLAPAVQDENGDYVANPVRCEMGGTLMQGNLPTNASTGVHSLDDVPIFAHGPGAEYFFGIMDNTEVFFGMAEAFHLDLLGDTDTAAE